MKVLHVVGSHPGFFRISPVFRALTAAGADRQVIVYAGHREDLSARGRFLEELELPAPDHVLGVSTGTSAAQTGRSLIALEALMLREAPDWIFAVGDVDSSLAAALVGRKNDVPVAHLEAGVRSGNSRAAAEVNRLLTDRLSDALFTAERQTRDQLVAEGIDPGRVHFVGNTAADTVLRLRKAAAALDLPSVMGLEAGTYIVGLLDLTSSGMDRPPLEGFLRALDGVAFETGRSTIVVLDQRSAAVVREQGLEDLLGPMSVVHSPSYVEILALVDDAGAVITNALELADCATIVGVPSVGIGDLAVGRADIFDRGAHVSARQLDGLPDVVMSLLRKRWPPKLPELWDGEAARRIAEITMARLPAVA